MKKLLKILHELGSIGLLGGYATNLMLSQGVAKPTPEAWAALRGGIDVVSTWLVVPSMLLVLLSGVFAIAAHLPFAERPWVWIKAASGLLVFEATFHLQGIARSLAGVATSALAGEAPPEDLAESLHGERGALWVMVSVCLINVVLGVWRPRWRPRK
jgi:hypothetical protein